MWAMGRSSCTQCCGWISAKERKQKQNGSCSSPDEKGRVDMEGSSADGMKRDSHVVMETELSDIPIKKGTVGEKPQMTPFSSLSNK